MKAPLVAVTIALAVVVVRGQAPQDPDRSSQTFRTNTDAVTVDVFVRAGNRVVGNLTAADFVLTDNGVRQRLESVDTAPVPLDISLVLDVSGDQLGTLPDKHTSSTEISALDVRIQQIARILRPEDRLRAVAVDTYVQDLFGLRSAAAVPGAPPIRSGGLSALYDAVLAAMLQPVDANRRHVVLVSTKGRDTISSVTPEAIRFVADRSDVLLHVVTMETNADNEAERLKFQCEHEGLCTPTRRFWAPFARPIFNSVRIEGGGYTHPLTAAGNVIAEAARLSGGALHQAALFSAPSTAATFQDAFEAFRRSYQLRFIPQGVKREGWHTLSVTVPGMPDATVRARRGYAIDVSPLNAAPPARPAVPTTFDELVDAYGRSEYAPVERALRGWADPTSLLRRLDEGGNPWPGTPRREAVFALELAEAGMFSKKQAVHEDARKLLNRFHRLIRHPLEPDRFERDWLWAEITILEGTIRPATTLSFIDNALGRFPGDPRLLLAKAIATDQYFPFMGSVPSPAQTAGGTATPAHVSSVTALYMAAMNFPDTAPEARVRLGWFLHRIGRDDEAIALLDDVKDADSPDRPLRYLRQLFRGHVLLALNRTDDAETAYRTALAIWPEAQSAEVGLMNALVRSGKRADADAMAEHIQTQTATLDPWFSYWLGDYRFFNGAIARLKDQIR